MIFVGNKAVKSIYKGAKRIVMVYRGSVLCYIAEKIVSAVGKIFSGETAKLTKIDSDTLNVNVDITSNETAVLTNDSIESIQVDSSIESQSTSSIEIVSSIVEGVVEIVSDDKAHVETGSVDGMESETPFIFDIKEPTLKDQQGLPKPVEQDMHVKDEVKLREGITHPQESITLFIFDTKEPTLKDQQGLPQPVKQEMYVENVTTLRDGTSRPQKTVSGGIFTIEKVTLLAQSIMSMPRVIRSVFSDIVKIEKSSTHPQKVKDDIFFESSIVTMDFGTTLQTPMEQEMLSIDDATLREGTTHPQNAITETYISDFARIRGETRDASAESEAIVDSYGVFDKTNGYPMEVIGDAISDSNSTVYKPEKTLDIDISAGGVSDSDSVIHKPNKRFKTDTPIQSGELARLFRIVCMKANTTARLISEPSLFKYVFLSASGGGISSSVGLLGKGTYEELFGWAVQYDNVLYIYQSNTAAQSDNTLSIDTGTVEAWHTQSDNILHINIASTAEQTDSELAIDTLAQLGTEEWVVQKDNVLLINGIVENAEIEVM